ncbi:EamA-like transporter family [Seminavis robusta]|uniref:EamA-like transporter family n=1 Tax=Seminavis robusta TaxID=568900 RepID=A0A9N8EKH6_9STRA|nr:EamA-like transporter family [Seminavis robusta]|eukprot:Sro1227_g254280.1 EamA-like transporter family (464) ;mRNA; f:11526-12917
MMRTTNAFLATVLLVGSATSFQLKPSVVPSNSIGSIRPKNNPYANLYYNPSQPQPIDNHDVSLYVTFLPDDSHDSNSPFFFRAPFPAEIPAVPSPFTDKVTQHEGSSTEGKLLWEPLLESYWGPRIVLMAIAAIYGTNFPLGAIMNDALPASAATCARMVLASLALSPFIPKISPHLRMPAILCGCATALGYVTQSVALIDTDPSKVSFLGAATVLWCPVLEWLVEKKPMGWKDAPQTWLAAMLCMAGVGCLELWGATDGMTAGVGKGDLLALVQAIGFGTGCFMSARMVQKEPDQVLPITSVLVATTAFWSMLWCFMDGWVGQPGYEAIALPGLLFADGFQTVAAAVVWTGLISTSLNFVIEISALGRVPPSEASVLLASEPLWAALLAATVFGQSEFGMNDYVGGACILAACLANAVLKPSDFERLPPWSWAADNKNNNNEQELVVVDVEFTGMSMNATRA